MRILVTNDDGIHAPGLATLEEIARELSEVKEIERCLRVMMREIILGVNNQYAVMEAK